MIISIMLGGLALLIAVTGMKCTTCLADDEVKKAKVAGIGGVFFIISGTSLTSMYLTSIGHYLSPPQDTLKLVRPDLPPHNTRINILFWTCKSYAVGSSPIIPIPLMAGSWFVLHALLNQRNDAGHSPVHVDLT